MSMRRPPTRLAAAFYCTAIIFSAAFLLIPAVRQFTYIKPLQGFFMLGFAPFFFQSLRKRETLNMTTGQIYEQAKLGSKFTPPLLEWAALIACGLAYYSY